MGGVRSVITTDRCRRPVLLTGLPLSANQCADEWGGLGCGDAGLGSWAGAWQGAGNLEGAARQCRFGEGKGMQCTSSTYK